MRGGSAIEELREKKNPEIPSLAMGERSYGHLMSLCSVSRDQRNGGLCPPSPVSKSRELGPCDRSHLYTNCITTQWSTRLRDFHF